MARIGSIPEWPAAGPTLAKARERAALVPDCLVEARRIAQSVNAGWHGRRRQGSGETFWQFRPYMPGESVARIDWRRSARDDQAYIRELEWEAAETVWLHADLSPSMRFASTTARASKEERAIILMLALAEILSRSGERIAVPGLLAPLASRNGAERVALSLARDTTEGLPDPVSVKGPASMVVFSDFLAEPDVIRAALEPLARRGITGHCVVIIDPAEDDFPYAGRTEFRDPESGARLLLGRPDSLREDYRRAFAARLAGLGDTIRQLGWTCHPHRTDRLASEALQALHAVLTGTVGRAAGPRAGA